MARVVALGVPPMVTTAAIVTTHNRHRQLDDLISDIQSDVDHLVVVDHLSDPPISYPGTIRVETYPPNISQLWNAGLNEVSGRVAGDYNVIVLNDDLRIGPKTIEKLGEALRSTGAAISFPDMHNRLRANQVELRQTEGPYDLFTRMSGFCYMLRGELELRLDETMQWWYSDDDIEWRASSLGGVVRVGGCAVTHLFPNSSTHDNPELQRQAGLDRARFVEKWGRAPW